MTRSVKDLKVEWKTDRASGRIDGIAPSIVLKIGASDSKRGFELSRNGRKELTKEFASGELDVHVAKP